MPKDMVDVDPQSTICLRVGRNPKTQRAKERFALYRDGMTIADYICAVGRKGLALADLAWDQNHEFITIKVPVSASDQAATEGEYIVQTAISLDAPAPQRDRSSILVRIGRDIKEDKYYAQNFSNNGERFVAWYLRNIYLRSPIQARDDITDGPDDKGIDAIFIDDDQRQIIAIQGKFYNETSVDHEPLHEILAAWLQLKDLEKLQENANHKLKIKLEAVRVALKDEYEIVFELLTTGQLTSYAERELVAFQDALENVNHPTMSITRVELSDPANSA